MLKSDFTSLFFTTLLLIACFGVSCTSQEQEHSIPVFPSAEEGGDAGLARISWIEKMHTGGQTESNWRAIERSNREEIRAQMKAKSSLRARTNVVDTLFPGYTAEWSERGSSNQAGSVHVSTYDSVTQVLYGISAGGSLWKGDLDGAEWEVIDQVRQLGRNVLEGIRLPNGNP